MRPKPLNAGQNLDEWIARHVLGWEPIVEAGPGLYWSRPDGELGSVPPFSTDKDAANMLRELLAAQGYDIPRRRSPLATCHAAADAVAQREPEPEPQAEPEPIAELAPDEPES